MNTKHPCHKEPSHVQDALRNFDSLPDSAHVRLPVVAALFACSPATVWRRVKKSAIPSPRRFSDGITAWNVGEIRKALIGDAGQTQGEGGQ